MRFNVGIDFNFGRIVDLVQVEMLFVAESMVAHHFCRIFGPVAKLVEIAAEDMVVQLQLNKWKQKVQSQRWRRNLSWWLVLDQVLRKNCSSDTKTVSLLYENFIYFWFLKWLEGITRGNELLTILINDKNLLINQLDFNTSINVWLRENIYLLIQWHDIKD